MKRILVTGAGGSAASNFVQSLRAAPAPFHIVGVDSAAPHLELADLDRRYLVPHAGAEGYIAALNAVIAAEHIDLVHPQPDVEVARISSRREAVAARTYLPAHETIELCQDKCALLACLRASSVPAPRTIPVRQPADLERSFDELRSGADRLWLRASNGAGSRAALPIRSCAQGREWIEFWADAHAVGWGDFIASEFLPGAEYAFQSLWRDGELLTSQARQREAYLFGNLTPSGQSSSPSVARTVHSDAVNEIAVQAVRAVDEQATGVFCVDLKENAAGVPCVTEINAGRFFTTSNFFTTAGLNMPHYYVQLAFDETLPALPRVNALPADWYWVRSVDMGYALFRGANWTSVKVTGQSNGNAKAQRAQRNTDARKAVQARTASSDQLLAGTA